MGPEDLNYLEQFGRAYGLGRGSFSLPPSKRRSAAASYEQEDPSVNIASAFHSAMEQAKGFVPEGQEDENDSNIHRAATQATVEAQNQAPGQSRSVTAGAPQRPGPETVVGSQAWRSKFPKTAQSVFPEPPPKSWVRASYGGGPTVDYAKGESLQGFSPGITRFTPEGRMGPGSASMVSIKPDDAGNTTPMYDRLQAEKLHRAAIEQELQYASLPISEKLRLQAEAAGHGRGYSDMAAVAAQYAHEEARASVEAEARQKGYPVNDPRTQQAIRDKAASLTNKYLMSLSGKSDLLGTALGGQP